MKLLMDVGLKFCVFLWLITGAECETSVSETKFTFQIGGSVTFPCLYHRKHVQNKKYLCFHANAAYNFCSILAYANETNGKVSVMDHPDQSLFTVTLRNLQEEDAGSYWCAVEIEGILNVDVTEKLRLTIQSVPDVSVVSSSVSGDEGGHISVRCFYSSACKNEHKRWCRSKGKDCYTSHNPSVEISDDGESFTVVMSGLMLSDSGWYFCSVGNLHVPVQLTVTARTAPSNTDSRTVSIPAVFSSIEAVTNNSTEEQDTILGLQMWLFLLVMLLLLMILVAMAIVIKKLQHKKNKTHVTHEKPDDSVNPECDVIYTSVIYIKTIKARSPGCEKENIIFSSV